MSLMNITSSESPKLKLFKAGLVSSQITSNIPGSTFYEIGSISTAPLSKESITIYCYGHYVFNIELDLDFVTQPNVSAFVTIADGVGGYTALDGGYQFTGDSVSFGIINPNSTPVTVGLPYSTVEIFYSIFYY